MIDATLASLTVEKQGHGASVADQFQIGPLSDDGVGEFLFVEFSDGTTYLIHHSGSFDKLIHMGQGRDGESEPNLFQTDAGALLVTGIRRGAFYEDAQDWLDTLDGCDIALNREVLDLSN